MRGAASLLTLVLVARSAGAITITDYFVSPAGSLPFGIASGPDGNVWFTGVNGASVFRVTPAGAITRWVIPHDEATPGPGPSMIVAGPDGGMWFTENYTAAWGGNKIGRIDPASGALTEFPLAPPDAHPFGIAAGSDGALWFTAGARYKVGRITTAGVVTEFAVPTSGSGPEAIVSGPDGALWYTTQTGVGRIATDGATSYFPLPYQVAPGLSVGPDSRLWFATYAGASGRPGLVSMGLDGSYAVLALLPGSSPSGGLASGPDGNVWFANGPARLGRMTPGGVQTDFRLATQSNTYHVSPGPDGEVWLTEGDYVGKVDLSSTGFHAVAPCRLVDTRNPAGPNGAPSLAAGSTRTFVTAGHCGLPLRGTVAIAVNLTVVNETGSGDLRIFPYGSSPPGTSSINFAAGVVRSNNAVLPVDLDGRFSVLCAMPGGGETGFVVDVAGHFQ